MAAAPHSEGAEFQLRVTEDRAPQKAASRRSKASDRTIVNETFANLFNSHFFGNAISTAGNKGISNRVAEFSINRENQILPGKLEGCI